METAQQKPEKHPAQAQQPEKQPTRIPVSKVWFHGPMDLPGGNSIAEVVVCGPAKIVGRQYFLAYFIPAHQVIELEWYRDSNSEPERDRISMSYVKRHREVPPAQR